MNFIQDVINLSVYDYKGRLITELDCLKNCKLKYRTIGEDTFIVVEDISFNLDMLRQIGRPDRPSETSDFEKRTEGYIEKETIRFNRNKRDSELKLIGSGVIYSSETGAVSHDFDIVIPKVKLATEQEYKFETQRAMFSNYCFKVLPYNANEDMFDIVLKERK